MEFQDKCPNCGHPREEGAAFCSNCGKPFPEHRPEEPGQAPQQQTIGSPAEPGEEKYVPWEDMKKWGFFSALWQTWKESVFNPELFFSRLPYKGGFGYPILYALIIIWIGTAFEQLWGLAFSGFMYQMMANFVPSDEMFWTTGLQTGFSLIYLIIAPVFIVLGLFVVSGIYHVIMMIFGWTNRDFEATFRSFSYSAGPLIFKIVPICGGLVGWIWTLVLSIIGLKHMQKTTSGKAALTIFIPIILCCCLSMILAAFFGAALLAFIKGVVQSGYYN